MKYITNYHLITVKYIGPSDVRGSRIKLISERFECSKTVSYDYATNSYDQAIEWLEKHGFNIIGTAEGDKVNYIITDTFKSFSELEITKRLVEA
jgi:hypothetical protein